MNDERYAAVLTHLAECAVKGVSDNAILDLAELCKADKRDVKQILNFRSDEDGSLQSN